MRLDIPQSEKPRIVVIGGGFAGINLVKILGKHKNYQVVLIDKQNYHSFQPLLYQVATADLEAQAIAFPFRKMFKGFKDFYFRYTEVLEIVPKKNMIITEIGELFYKYLVIATGSRTNFFNMEGLQIFAMPMKTIIEALDLRSMVLQNFEKTLSVKNQRKKKSIMHYVIAGGGPTGVELAGALGEIKKNVLPKEYPEIPTETMQITLVQSQSRILPSFLRET